MKTNLARKLIFWVFTTGGAKHMDFTFTLLIK